MKHLLSQKQLSKLTTTIIVCLLSWSAYAGEGKGTHDFGLNITQNQSCEIAKLKATKNLIENELGVVIEARDLMTCLDNNCEFNSFKWVLYPAILKRTTFQTKIEELPTGRVCTATVQGEVLSLENHYEENHDFSITMSKNGNYHDNDFLKINVYGLSKLYYQVFVVTDTVKRLYPNVHHNENKVQNLTIPNSNYDLLVKKAENPNSMIVVVSSPKKFTMNSTYNINDFTEKLLSMKLKGFRLRTYNYSVQ